MRTWQRVCACAVGASMIVVMPATSLGDTYKVKAKGGPANFRWDPKKREITKGDKIVWKNVSDYNHRVDAYAGDWDKNTLIEPGEKTKKRFKKKGKFKYRCSISGHSTLSNGKCSGMCGKIVVRS